MQHKVPGLFYIANYITQQEEKCYLEWLNNDTVVVDDDVKQQQQWSPVGISQRSRKVLQFGSSYSYSDKTSKKLSDIPIPTCLDCLFNSERHPCPPLVDWHPDQLIINRYLPGQGISPHIDSPTLFGDTIACVTLGSATTILFSRQDQDEVVKVLVEPRSLYVLTKDARYQWKHGIAPLKKDGSLSRKTRFSLTFRTMKSVPK